MDNSENKFRGCLIGGAAGDALGYAVEFMNEAAIFSEYGKHGITEYKLSNGTARISDDTQMTMFTAAALIDGTFSGNYEESISRGYLAWYKTQTGGAFSRITEDDNSQIGRLLRIPELYARRAPGVTCLSALGSGKPGTIENPLNDSKGCGGVMRVTPIGLMFANGGFPEFTQKEIDMLGAKAAAVTHGHELGYIPAAVNHNGDSDSTGAVCGNILGTFLGYDKIPQKFKENLELHDILLDLADELVICSPKKV